MMARHEMSIPLLRPPVPRLACGIQLRRSALQGTGQAAECVSSDCACNHDPSADDAHAHVDVSVFRPSLSIMIRVTHIQAPLQEIIRFADAGLLSISVMIARVESAIMSFAALESHSSISSFSAVRFTSIAFIT
jgi:hypothetical protein